MSRDLLDPSCPLSFLASFAEFAARTALLGALNGLSQLALKALMPGVPDFYQGSEFWDFSLVDPDNRRAVDFAARKQVLASDLSKIGELAAHWSDGHVKLALMQKLLRLRHDFSELLRHGSYEPENIVGPCSNHVIAFTRRWKSDELLIAVARHFTPLTNGGRQWFESVDAKTRS